MGYLQLDRCTGPPCPRCGCQDVEILRWPIEGNNSLPFIHPDPQKAAAWGGGSWWNQGRGRCNHCYAEFTFRELPGAVDALQTQAPEEEPPDDEPDAEPLPAPSTPASLAVAASPRKPTECPSCRGRFHVYKTRAAKQYRRCKDCGHRGETAAAD